MITKEELITQGVGFFSMKGDRYSFVAECLADGLTELGIPVYGTINLDTTQAFSTYQIPFASEEIVANCGLLIIDVTEGAVENFKNTPLSINRGNFILLSNADNIDTFVIKSDAPFLSCHRTSKYEMPYNRVPWAFGISRQLEEMSRSCSNLEPRENTILSNFRPSQNQAVREALSLSLQKKLEHHFTIDRSISEDGRFGNNHYDKLKTYRACFAYGGTFRTNMLLNSYFANNPAIADFFSQFTFHEETVIARWDSWRFWESMALGCTTIALDMDRYGLELPVKPENWKHYIGIDMEHIERDVQRIVDTPDILKEIGDAGREWALQHYTPRAVAERLISMVEQPTFLP